VFDTPSVYAGATLVFGLASLLTAYATTYAHLLVLRLIIGLAEATIQTGFVYMSLWYRREEMSVRVSYVFAFTPLAGAVAGLISYGIQRGLENSGAHRAWQWLFIIEGAGTMVWAIVLWIVFPAMPDKELAKKRSRWFKDPEERRLIVMRSQAGTSIRNWSFGFLKEGAHC
jgi:MFS family permease